MTYNAVHSTSSIYGNTNMMYVMHYMFSCVIYMTLLRLQSLTVLLSTSGTVQSGPGPTVFQVPCTNTRKKWWDYYYYFLVVPRWVTLTTICTLNLYCQVFIRDVPDIRCPAISGSFPAIRYLAGYYPAGYPAFFCLSFGNTFWSFVFQWPHFLFLYGIH